MSVLAVDNSDPTGTTFVESPAGPVELKIQSKTGTVIFDQTNTVLKDATGAAISGTSFASPNQFKLSLSAGSSCTLTAVYVCLPPNSTGFLMEDAPGGIVLSEILPSTTGQIFTLRA
jgi:hypothetical protein